MKIEYREKCRDIDSPVIYLKPESYEDAFKLGSIFESGKKNNMFIWSLGEGAIRVAIGIKLDVLSSSTVTTETI